MENTSSARFAIEPLTGRRWVRKCVSVSGFEALQAEAVSWHLGQILGAPVPHAAVYTDVDGNTSWLSELVPGSQIWEESLRDYITNLDGLAGMTVLDALVFNDDRHKGNILLQPAPNEAHLRLWAIDAGNAKVGWIDDFMACGVDVPHPRNHARGLPVDAISEGCEVIALRARGISHGAICALAGDAAAIAGEDPRRADALAAALLSRILDAPAIVREYLRRLEALR